MLSGLSMRNELIFVNYFQSGPLWRYAKNVGDAYKSAVTHPGAKTETHTFSEI